MKMTASLPNCRRRGNVCLSLPTFNYRRDTLVETVLTDT